MLWRTLFEVDATSFQQLLGIYNVLLSINVGRCWYVNILSNWEYTVKLIDDMNDMPMVMIVVEL